MDEEIYVYKKIDAIKFGVLSPKMIKEMAAAKIVTPELYDKEGYPVDGGLMDTRLGVIDPGLKCKTCGSKLKECTGHFGYIELARPVIHIKYIKIINDLLKCTCKECGRILISEEEIKKNLKKIESKGKKKFKKILMKEIIMQSKAITKCPHCNAKLEKIRFEKPTNFYEGEKRLSPIEVRTRLEKIPDDDLKLFGYNPSVFRPEWTVLTLLPIPPVTMRPSITLESGERSEDDLTHKLGDVVRINQRLFENINAGAPEIIIEDLWDLLQYHITTFFDNNVAQLPPARHRSGQPLKTLTERIKSKEGRIRHNLAGKRTNFSSRTVISPDSMIAIDEVGVPKQVAMKLTIPERITEWNFEYLKEYVKRGPKQYPGANYVCRPDGKKKKITEETKEQLLEELQIGYIVERHLIDGDIAIFNRQPSLHRMSMMCHRVKVLPGLTFRLNPSVCAPYNADFDGDEMNLHIPQTEEARAEAEILMEVETQLISPRYGLGIIACNHDSIAGNYMLTKMLEMPRKEAIQLLASIGVENFDDLPKKEIVSGAEIFSVLIPKDFDFVGKAKDGTKVVIEKGKLVEGFMDSANLGSGSGLMIRNLHKKYGSKKALEILGQIFRLGVKTLLMHGFTAAFSDTDLKEESKKEIEDILKNAENKVDELIEIYKKGELDTYPGRTTAETLELKILEVLNKARNDAGRVVSKSLDKTKNTLIMSISGARGNIVNLAQMAAVVGQQALRGKRIERGYKNRTLSCFKPGDLRPAARGFIKTSFKKGMHPAEFFFMAMTGRDSLMDTALRTPKSGYLYRRLANAMQDLKVEYDNTVRNASKKIVQFQYGEDGVDVSKSEAGKINVKRIIDSVLNEKN
ncbi:MAG: DNA-directed RNA polymerase subunit A' [Candidatus Woesearchaeota archaeon]